MPALKRKSDMVSDPVVKKSKPSHPQKSSVSILREEPAFPRGGASVLTPLEHKQIQIQANQDVLFEQSTGKKARAFDSEDDENEGDDAVEGDYVATTVGRKRRSQAADGKKQKTSKVVDEPKLKIEGLSYKVSRITGGWISLLRASSVWSLGLWSSARFYRSTDMTSLFRYLITLLATYL